MLKASIQLYKNAYTGLSRDIWWLAVVIFVNRAGTMVIPFLTVYLLEKGFTLTQAGYAMGVFGLGSIAGGYIGGKLTDRFHFYHVQFFSLLFNGILFIVLGEMKTLYQIFSCIFVLSTLGEAFRPANAAAIAAYSNEANRTRAYSLNRLAINLGWSVGPAIGGVLASMQYKLLFWVDGMTCIFAAIVLYFFLKPSKQAIEKEPEVKNGHRSSALKDKVFLQGMFCLFLVGSCFFQLFSIFPVFLKTEMHLNEATIGWILAFNGLLIVLFEMVLVYSLEGRRSNYDFMILGTFLIGVSYIVLNIAPLLSVALVSTVVVTFGEMLLFPFINNFWVNRTTHANRGEYAAYFTISFALAMVLAPALASLIASQKGFDFLWTVNFVVCTLAAAGFWLLKKTSHATV